MPTGISSAPATLSRLRWYALIAVVLAIAAAYRLPGVSWGFDFNTYPYATAHPDDGICCLDAMKRGIAEVQDASNPVERGMMAQCVLLGRLFERPADLNTRARIGRTYSVMWGLLTILLTALITRRLAGDVAAIFAALLLTTSGINIVTSFFVRGQIQAVAFSLASMLVALRLRRVRERAATLMFVASALAGAAIATRWTLALIPMLLACAVARGPIVAKLGATACGLLFGFFGSTGFYFSPDLAAMNFEVQKQMLVMLYSRITPVTTAAAAVLCTLAGTGLVTFACALWFGIDRARRLRRFPRADLTWANLRSALDSPQAIIGIPVAITFVMVCFNKAFDARYVDLFAPPLAIMAGITLAALWRRSRILVAALIAYQGIYGAGVLSRYTNDSRKVMNAAIADVWKSRGTIFQTQYVSDLPLFNGHRLGPGQGPWDADWVVISDLYAGQYLTASGTFPFVGAPKSCREILYCDGERERAFFQKLYAGDGWDLVYVAKAASWTPELKLHHALMTSKWAFTGDIRLFHKRPP